MSKRHFYLQWDSTDICNLKCSHCYHGDENSHIQKKKILSLEEAILMIDDLKLTSEEWGMIPRIAISGGDPLMRKDLYQILEYTQKEGVITNLLTNGTLLTDQKAKDIKERGVNTLQISFDGNKETHNKIRGKYFAFDKAIEGIYNAIDAGIGIVVAMTATKENKDQFEEVIEVAYNAGADKVAFKTYVPDISLGSNDPLYLGKNEIYEMIKHTNELTEKYAGKIQVLHSDVLWQVMEPSNPLIEKAKRENKFIWGCSAGFRSLSVLSDGTVYPCRRLPIEIGHISDGIAKLVVESEVMRNLRDLDQMKTNTLCDKVSHCRGCRGIAYAVKGDYMAKDPMCYKDLMKDQND